MSALTRRERVATPRGTGIEQTESLCWYSPLRTERRIPSQSICCPVFGLGVLSSLTLVSGREARLNVVHPGLPLSIDCKRAVNQLAV